MSRSAVARPQLTEHYATIPLLGGDNAAVHPADDWARVRRPQAIAATVAADLTGRPPSLREYVRTLFVEGGGTIITAGGQTLVQPDGDLVVTLAHSASHSRVDEWNQHLEHVATWLSGLRHRLTLADRRLTILRLLALSIVPLVAVFTAWAAGTPAEAFSAPSSAVGITAVVMAALTLVETFLSLGGSISDSGTLSRASTGLGHVRRSKPYAAVLAIAPAALATWSALLSGQPLTALIAILGPASALAIILYVRLALRRVLKSHGLRHS